MKIITETNDEISLKINEVRTKEEVNNYLKNFVANNVNLPNLTDSMLSQYKSNTYNISIVRYETNTEQDLNIFINVPLNTKNDRGLLSGFIEGDVLFIRQPIVPNNLKNVLLRKLFFVGNDGVILEVKGVSPSLITEVGNSFLYRHTLEQGDFLYWYNQHPGQVGISSFSLTKDIFISGFISIGLTKNLPREYFPILYDWVEKNPDNALKIDKEKQLIIFPEAQNSFLQVRDNNFSLKQDSLTIPKDTNPILSYYYAASDKKQNIKIKTDINGTGITFLAPNNIPREENIIVSKNNNSFTRLENSRGINVLIKAI